MKRPARPIVIVLWGAVGILVIIAIGVAGGRLASVVGATRGGFFPGPPRRSWS